MNELDNFYNELQEPLQGCFFALRRIILSLDDEVKATWKYSCPFFTFRGKMFCYIWINKKTKHPYIGVVEGRRIDHPALEQGNRTRMKILSINPNEDIEIDTIQCILNQALDFYRLGIIKTKK